MTYPIEVSFLYFVAIMCCCALSFWAGYKIGKDE